MMSDFFSIEALSETLNTLVTSVNGVLWGKNILVIILIAGGLWFTWKLKAIQFTHFKKMFSLMKGSNAKSDLGISSFQALCTSLSARVGTGNLAGVAVAISVGGPGAIFWMWVIAFLGMAVGYAESLLGQAYKVKNCDGEYRGGPAYYIRLGLNKPVLAVMFSCCLFLGYGFVFSGLQANSIVDALNHTYDIDKQISGMAIVLVAGLVLIAGLNGVVNFAERIVPVVGVLYVAFTLIVTLINIDLLPGVLLTIVQSAFGFGELAGGTLGIIIQTGVQRGLYSNEAGSGSVPHVAACANAHPNHPASQGLIQALGVFFDTILLCSCTAFIILMSGVTPGAEVEGITLTQKAMTAHLGEYGDDFIAVAITLFSFTSVTANYAYGECNLKIFGLDSKAGRSLFKLAYLGAIYLGTQLTMLLVLSLADMALAFMTLINMLAIAMLTPTVVSLTKDYIQKSQSGEVVTYQKGDCEIQGVHSDNVWVEADKNDKDAAPLSSASTPAQ